MHRTPTPLACPARRGRRLLRMVLMMSMKRLMMSRWMRCSLAKVVEAMRSNDNWGFNNWRSCAGGHVYLVGRSFKLPYSPYGHMMLTYVSGVGVPLSRCVVLLRAATR